MKQNEQTKVEFFVGIDMSKAKFDVGVINKRGDRISHKKFINNELGFEDFFNWLSESFNIVAMSAIKYNPIMKSYFQKKKKEGKKGFVPINNVKNKIIQQVWAIIRSGKVFDLNYKHPKAA